MSKLEPLPFKNPLIFFLSEHGDIYGGEQLRPGADHQKQGLSQGNGDI